MAVAGISITLDQTELRNLIAALGGIFQPADKSAILAAALEKAIQPAYARLRETTPVGPTGNLLRAATYKVKEYPGQGNAVAILGYKRAGVGKSQSAAGGTVEVGPDRAYHQWFLENGTQPRVIKTFSNKKYIRRAHLRHMRSGKVAAVSQHEVSGQNAYIASSLNRLGPFEFSPTPRMPRGQMGQRVQTNPPYQRAFFKKSKNPIVIPPMPVGGYTGRPPLQSAWNDSQQQVADILQQELRISLERAISALTFSATGTAD